MTDSEHPAAHDLADASMSEPRTIPTRVHYAHGGGRFHRGNHLLADYYDREVGDLIERAFEREAATPPLDVERRLFDLAQQGHSVIIRRHAAIPPGGTFANITEGITVHIQGNGIVRQSNAHTTLTACLDDIDRAIERARLAQQDGTGEPRA